MSRFPRGFDLALASAHLGKRDRKLGRWTERIGPIETSGWRKPFDTVDSLARSILYQQLSGKAAAQESAKTAEADVEKLHAKIGQ